MVKTYKFDNLDYIVDIKTTCEKMLQIRTNILSFLSEMNNVA